MKAKMKRLTSLVAVLVMTVAFLANDFPVSRVQAETEGTKVSAEVNLNVICKYLYLGVEGKNTFDFNVGKNTALEGATYHWYIRKNKGNPDSVSINPKTGVVTAEKAGTAYIRCRITLSDMTVLRPEAKVVVINSITEVAINNIPENQTIEAGKSTDFNRSVLNTAAGKSAAANGITRWEIADDTAGVGSASENGTVIPSKAGDFSIRAVCFANQADYKLWSVDKEAYANKITASSDWTKITVITHEGTAATPEQLAELLAAEDITKITLATQEALDIILLEESYPDKTLIVDAPNVNIENHAYFKKIILKPANYTVWLECISGNNLTIMDRNVLMYATDTANIENILVGDETEEASESLSESVSNINETIIKNFALTFAGSGTTINLFTQLPPGQLLNTSPNPGGGVEMNTGIGGTDTGRAVILASNGADMSSGSGGSISGNSGGITGGGTGGLLNGGGGNIISGGTGNIISGGTGGSGSIITGGNGGGIISGSGGSLIGGNGGGLIIGSGGAISNGNGGLIGGAGNNTIIGGAGSDTIIGGNGGNIIAGGSSGGFSGYGQGGSTLFGGGGGTIGAGWGLPSGNSVSGSGSLIFYTDKPETPVYINTKSTVTLNGTGSFVLSMSNGSAGSTVSSSVPVKIVASVNATYNLGPGSEGSIIAFPPAAVGSQVYNNSKQDIILVFIRSNGSLSNGIVIVHSGQTAAITNTGATVTGMEKTTPVISTPITASAVYEGQSLSVSTLGGRFKDAGTNQQIGGTITWDSPTSVLAASGVYAWTFTPSDEASYHEVKGTVKVNVISKITPAAGIILSTAISEGQHLSASALTGSFYNAAICLIVEGTLEWDNPTQVVNTPGNYSWTFTPADAVHYKEVKGTSAVQLNIISVTPVTGIAITAAAINEGQSLSTSALSGSFKNGTTNQTVEGTLVWDNPAAVVTASGNYGWTFTPADAVHYKEVKGTATVQVNIISVTPVTGSAIAATAISEGQPLSASTLNGSFKNGTTNQAVEGTLAWDTPVAVVTASGNYGWTFTPADTVHYKVVKGTTTVQVNIVQVTPVTGSAITATIINEGQSLSASALSGSFKNGTTNQAVEGTLTWDTPAAVVSASGSHNWTFTPADTVHYKVVKGTATVQVNIVQVTPVTGSAITAAIINEGQPLSASALSGSFKNGTTNQAVEGTLAWINSEVIVNSTGDYGWIFTPSDTDHYNTVQGTATVQVNIVPITPVTGSAITATIINEGQSLSASALSGSFKNGTTNQTVEGTLAWINSEVIVNSTGDYGWIFTPSDTDHYNTVQGTATVQVNIVQVTPVPDIAVTATTINAGEPLSASTLNGSFKNGTTNQPVEGTLTWYYTDIIVVTQYEFTWIFHPTDTIHYKEVAGTVSVDISAQTFPLDWLIVMANAINAIKAGEYNVNISDEAVQTVGNTQEKQDALKAEINKSQYGVDIVSVVWNNYTSKYDVIISKDGKLAVTSVIAHFY